MAVPFGTTIVWDILKLLSSGLEGIVQEGDGDGQTGAILSRHDDLSCTQANGRNLKSSK